MNVIRQPNQDIIDFLGFQVKKKNCKYRFNKYCFFVKENNRNTIIYNALTGGMVEIKNIELTNIFTDSPYVQQEHLLQGYYLVKEDFDESSVIDAYRQCRKKFVGGSYLDNPSSFVIMTTSKCNARCPYCYELTVKGKSHMTDETLEKVTKYIIDNAPYNAIISLMFFGGEPLYNKHVIDIITSRVLGSGRNIATSMITNGYLFDEELVEVALKDWGMDHCQITLDGTEEAYNNIKKYIYKDDPSPFKRIINNIHLLTNAKIRVSIRLNIGINNIENIKELCKYLFEEFKDNKYVTIYPWEIFQEATYENSEKLYKGIGEILEMIFNAGFQEDDILDYGIKTAHCMVDDGNTVLINEKGQLGLCEHYIDSLMFSDIEHPEIKDEEVINSWFDYVKTDKEICKDCKIRPVCLKMHKCTDDFICNEYIKDYQYKKLELRIKNYVTKSPNAEDNLVKNNCCIENKQ